MKIIIRNERVRISRKEGVKSFDNNNIRVIRNASVAASATSPSARRREKKIIRNQNEATKIFK